MKNKTIICKTCYFREKYENDFWCKIIENEGGGSIKANLTECEHYLKKGTEPKWSCVVCGKNTYGESSTSEGGKTYCSNCYWKMEGKKYKQKIKDRNDEIIKIIGDKKKADEVIKLI